MIFLLSLFVPIVLAQEPLTFDVPSKPDGKDWTIQLPAVDTDKICRGIAVAETSGCTAGVALSKNNCHGIGGPGGFQTFNSFEESQAACIDLWNRKYGDYPTMADARLYTDNPNPTRWYSVVTHYYNTH